MSMKQIHFDSSIVNFKRRTARLSAMAFLIIGISFTASATIAAENSSDRETRYQAERAVCNSGLSNQDRATCMKEAGAALKASKEGQLNNNQNAQNQNALIRCNALPPDDRDACQRRINGEGSTSGSVETGGVIRELVVPDKK